jgi:RNA polymerase sigma-70 factor (ECF subfamily)
MRGIRGADDEDELARWLEAGYAKAFRTALLLLRNRADAEEAVQDAFLRAWRFRAAVPAGNGIEPWLYRVVVNASLSKLRADATRRTRSVPIGDLSPQRSGLSHDRTGDPEAAALERDRRQALLDAVGALPDHLRVVVALRYYAQLSEKEIAEVIHRRPGTVKSRLHAARTALAGDARLVDLADVPRPLQAQEAR